MTTRVQITLAALLVLQGACLGGAKVLRVAGMPERAEHVGFTADGYRFIGVLELLAATGVALGLVVPAIGVLAASGLVLLLAGAVVAHLRAGDGLAGAAPALVVAGLAVAYLITLL